MATTELEPSRPALAPARPVDWLRPRAAAALRIAWTLRRADLAALLVLIGGALLVHWPTVVGVGVYARDDTITFFYPLSKPAALLLVPYLAWVTFAAALNFSVWRLNGPRPA